MPTQQIVSRFDGRILYGCEADSLSEALEQAVKTESDLSEGDLRGCDLRESDLRGCDLRWCDLSGSILRESDLRESDLRESDLSRCDLSRCDLRRCDLRGSDLRGCILRESDLSGSDLRGLTINWTSHDLLAEILRRAADDNIERRMLAGLVLISHDWCWQEFLAIQHPEQNWALGVLREYVRDGYDAPDVLRKAAQHEGTEV